MISFKNLTVGFNKEVVLSGLNGDIPEGKMIALMGVNGAGKSCLLKTLAMLNSPLAGEVSIDGRNFKNYSNLEVAKIMSVVLTDKIQADFLRVHELMSLGRSPYTNFWGDLSQEDKHSIDEVIKLLKIESIYDRYFSDLSDGQKQKVLLGRALVQNPRYLFLDEPSTYLDIPSKIELMKIFKIICHDKKMGVFFSTHDLHLVENVVDEIWLIDSDGKLHKKGPEEMHRSGLLKENFNI